MAQTVAAGADAPCRRALRGGFQGRRDSIACSSAFSA